MATIWVTYDWDDNEVGDLDFIAQELGKTGLTVNLDRRKLRAGLALWSEIERFIKDPAQCDAWVLFATQDSLASDACLKELLFAFDRAAHARGERFPLIVLFRGTMDQGLIPPTMKARLYVSLADPAWSESIAASAEAHEVKDTPLATATFFLGFLGILLISLSSGGPN